MRQGARGEHFQGRLRLPSLPAALPRIMPLRRLAGGLDAALPPACRFVMIDDSDAAADSGSGSAAEPEREIGGAGQRFRGIDRLPRPLRLELRELYLRDDWFLDGMFNARAT